MKRIILPALAATILLAACSKDPVNTTASLVVSKTTGIRKGEPVVFQLLNNPDSITWKVRPAINSQVVSEGSLASIKFGGSGNYTITATSGTVADSAVVQVGDSIYTPPSTSTTVALAANDQVIIAASKLDSGNFSGLILSAQTQKTYSCLVNNLISTFNVANGNYTIEYTGVSVPAGCNAGTSRAGTFAYLIPLNDGTHTLTIKLGATTYTGSLVKAGSNYTINWSYTSGVTISPATL